MPVGTYYLLLTTHYSFLTTDYYLTLLVYLTTDCELHRMQSGVVSQSYAQSIPSQEELCVMKKKLVFLALKKRHLIRIVTT